MSTLQDELLKVHVVRDDTAPVPKAPRDIAIITKTYFPGPVPELILPHAPSRLRYFIRTIGAAATTPNGGTALTKYNTVTGPGAGQQLLSITIPATAVAGVYNISAFTAFNGSGIVAATDSDNVVININGQLFATVNTDVAAVNSNAFPPSSYGNAFLRPGDVVTLNTINASAGTSIYRNNLTITPVAGSAAGNGNVILAGSNGDAAASAAAALLNQNMAGVMYGAGVEIKGEGTTELWVVSPFASPCAVSVMSEYKK